MELLYEAVRRYSALGSAGKVLASSPGSYLGSLLVWHQFG